MAGRICHVEIHSTDLAATRTFTSELFGWKFQEFRPDYWLFAAEEGCGGGICRVSKSAGVGDIQVYISVDSIEETCEKAVALGGAVVTQRTEIGGGFGFFACLKDPGGTVYAVWQAGSP